MVEPVPVADAVDFRAPSAGSVPFAGSANREPPVLPEPFATNLNAKRLPGAAQGDRRPPECGRLLEHLAGGTFTSREGGREGRSGSQRFCFTGFASLHHPLNFGHWL